MQNGRPSASALKAQRNNLRPGRNVGRLFVGPLPRGARRMPARPVQQVSNQRRVLAPVATGTVIRGNTGGDLVFRLPLRKEYVGDVAGSVAYTVTKYAVNPGLPELHPWCSQIAPSFDEYEVESMAFHYEPESSSSGTGAVMLGFDPDAYDTPPTSKAEILTFQSNVKSQAWIPCTLVLNAAELRKRGILFTRTGVVEGDKKTYDLGAWPCVAT